LADFAYDVVMTSQQQHWSSASRRPTQLSSGGAAVSNKKEQRVWIELTSDQREQIKHASGRECESVELTIDELEQRVVPSLFTSCATGKPISNPSQ
jgi:hypothetical protein